FGKKYRSPLGKIWGMVEFDIKEFIAGISFNPDIFLSHGSIYAAHAAFLMRKPHISLEDTYNFEQIRLYKPFTKYILTADYDHPLKSDKVIRYAGYHELAYLHPQRFTPDASIYHELGVTADEKYLILRFVSWNASHDIGHSGISYENKIRVVKDFSRYARVFISSEGILPDELESYRIPIKPHRIHDAMAFASLVFGESATMVSEASCLGIPGIYLDNSGRLYTKEQEEKYDQCFNYTESLADQELAIAKGIELLKQSDLRNVWLKKRDRMLGDKIDVTAFFVWFIENYPQSVQVIKDNPDCLYKFK
ncbi:MAG TPA: hypothetical protein PKW61_05580, partial [Tenuifilaceae bacterium]|nr:hypothetical protein [Tenuifilaceae bacterium]